MRRASVARLTITSTGDRSAVRSAFARSPQRWSGLRVTAAGRVSAVHQLLGDGVHGGECHRLTLRVGAAASLLVRTVAATPLRAGGPSATVTHILAGDGATAVYLPGALIPHRGVEHSSVVRVWAAGDARVLVASMLALGRTRTTGDGPFRRLRLGECFRVAGRLVLAQDQRLHPDQPLMAGPGALSAGEVFLSYTVLGDWPPATEVWWEELARGAGLSLATGPLAVHGRVVRAVAPHLGAAERFGARVREAIEAARSVGSADLPA